MNCSIVADNVVNNNISVRLLGFYGFDFCVVNAISRWVNKFAYLLYYKKVPASCSFRVRVFAALVKYPPRNDYKKKRQHMENELKNELKISKKMRCDLKKWEASEWLGWNGNYDAKYP